MFNGLTLRISKWYKWLKFKDIVQGFGKLKKMVEKKWNGLEDQTISNANANANAKFGTQKCKNAIFDI